MRAKGGGYTRSSFPRSLSPNPCTPTLEPYLERPVDPRENGRRPLHLQVLGRVLAPPQRPSPSLHPDYTRTLVNASAELHTILGLI